MNVAAPLPEEIAGVLFRDIVSGAYPVGARLPTEHTLVTRFGVSRAVVREAISRLKADGLVVARRGSGLYVAPLGARSSFKIDADTLGDSDEIRAILELRETVEEAVAALAAERRTAELMARIDRAHEAFLAADDRTEASVQADVAFHVAIAEATANPYFVRFVSLLGSGLAKVIRGVFQAGRSAQVKWDTAEEHRGIVEAIRARDAATARLAARTHLEGVRRRIGVGCGS